MAKISVFLLALGAFVTGTAELIVGGIVKPIADDLHVSLGMAGQLVSAFSVSFAIGAPIVISLTSRMGRKKLLSYALFLFILGCFVSFASTTYAMLMGFRVIVGLSAGVFTVVAFGAAAKLVPAEKIGKAVGTVALGISTSMVIGVPVGMAITKVWNWQAVFVSLGILSLIVLLLLIRFLPEIEGDESVPMNKQFLIFRNPVIVSTLAFSFFFSLSASAMNSYVTPYLQDIVHLGTSKTGYMMLALGVFSVLGSRMGGEWVDKWGAPRILMSGLAAAAITLGLLPLVSTPLPAPLLILFLWMFSMAVTIPSIQTFIIQQAPGSANLVLSFNTSVLHLGVAAGAGIGGVIVETTSTVAHQPLVAGLSAALSLITVLLAVRRITRVTQKRRETI